LSSNGQSLVSISGAEACGLMVYALESVWIRAMAKVVDFGAVAIDVQLFVVSFSQEGEFWSQNSWQNGKSARPSLLSQHGIASRLT
jgi:hypothetical protein